MKNKKRQLLAMLICVLMVFTMIPNVAFAAGETGGITSSSDEVKAGETITVSVKVPEISSKLSNFKLSVSFDKEAFEVMEFAPVTLTGGTLTASTVAEANTNGVYIAAYSGQGGENAIDVTNGYTLSAKLKVKESASIGVKTFSLVESGSTACKIVALREDGYTEDDKTPAGLVKGTTVTVIKELTGTQAITGVTAPVKNAAPVTTVTAPTNTTATIKWYSVSAGPDVEFSGNKFARDTVYKAVINIKPADYYQFADKAELTVDSEKWTSAKQPDGSYNLTKTFDKTASKSITKLEVTNQPATTNYTHGDTFNATGMVVQATYDDGTTDDAFTGYTVSYTNGKSYLKKDDTSVTLNAGENTAEVTGLTVGAKTLNITGLKATSRAYDGTTNVRLTGGELSGVVGGETVSVTMPTTGTIANANVGTGKAVTVTLPKLTGTDANNYTLANIADVKVNITTANYTFDNSNLGVATNVNVGNNYPATINDAKAAGVGSEKVTGTVKWYTDGACTKEATGQFKKEGTETLYYVFTPAEGNTNYVKTTTKGSVSFTVTALPLQDFAEGFTDAKSATYGENAFTKTTSTTEGGTITYKSSSTAVATVDANNGEVTIKGAGTAIITATAAEKEYNGQKYATTEASYTLTVAQKALAFGDFEEAKKTLTKVYDGSTKASELVSYNVKSASLVSGDSLTVAQSAAFNSKNVSEASSITVTFGAISGDGAKNYKLDFKTAELSGAKITAKPVTVVVAEASRAYGEDNPAFTGALKEESSMATGESYADLKMTYSTEASKTSAPNSYNVTGTSGNSNYAVTVEGTGKLTVTKTAPKKADFVLSAESVTYDGNGKSVTVNVAKGVTGMGTVAVKYNGEAAAPANAGTYKISIDVAEGTNYAAAENIELGSFVIEKATPVAANFSFTAPTDKKFDGTAKVATVAAADGVTGIGNLSVEYNGSTKVPTAVGTYTVTVTAAEGANYTAAKSIGNEEWTFAITKADAKNFGELAKQVVYSDKNIQTVDLSKLMPAAATGVTYTVGTLTNSSSGYIIVEEAKISENGILTFKLNDYSTDNGMHTNIPVTIKSDCYGDSTVSVKVCTVTGAQLVKLDVKNISMDYGTDVKITKANIKGKATQNGTEIAGSWKFKSGDDLEISTVAQSGSYIVVFTPDTELGTYTDLETMINITIKPAKVTGTLTFANAKVTESGKTLGDITPSSEDLNKLSPNGTFAWNDGEATAIEQGKSYGWTFTPSDANYESLTGTVTPWAKSATGGGGGGGYVAPTTAQTTAKTFITTNLTAGGKVYAAASADNYKAILAAEDAYAKLSASEQAALDKELKAQTGKTLAELAAEAEVIKAELEPADKAVTKAEVKATKLKVKSKAVTLNGKKAIKISWSITDGDLEKGDFDGFAIYRSTKKNSGYGKSAYFNTTKFTYTNNKNLKAGRTYYYKIRAYKYIDGVKTFTEYSTKAWRTIK